GPPWTGTSRRGLRVEPPCRRTPRMTSRARTFGIAPPRFHVAVHILVWLAKTGDVCPSNEIASEVRGHATFLRRVLAPLVQAGIVEAREGRVGGYTLAKPAERISLGEVYTVLRGAAAPGEKGAVGGDEGTGRSEERRVGKEGRARWSPYHGREGRED